MNQEQYRSVPNWILPESHDRVIEFVVTVLAMQFSENDIVSIKNCLEHENIIIKSFKHNELNNVINVVVNTSTQKANSLFEQLSEHGIKSGFDVTVIPADRQDIKLLVCDMDSTIVQTETLDELANLAGIGAQVSEITTKAMRGEIDFETALDERVGLLAGMESGLLDQVATTTQCNCGAETLIKSAKAHGLRTVLVSGGFESIVKVIANKLGFDRYVCNKMTIENGLITGKVDKPVVDSAMKLAVLNEECRNLNIEPEQVCAIGDGANDMPMINAAGIGISYYGKPILRNATPYQINITDLESVLYMMGIKSC
ncbi:MAG: phosphoserine phosphatase SerB [Proteobacteria bacterium]|nr:phosphoserine phosphatase SerB [Pseudomonadota bacterium]NOG59878.1 phosphoserine phosphatase SerB [Pseudomonadota bacterium]